MKCFSYYLDIISKNVIFVGSCIVDVVDEHMLVFDPRRNEDTFFFKGAPQRTRDLTKRQPREQKFAFEKIFSTASTNEDVYNASTHDLLDTLLSGYNCSGWFCMMYIIRMQLACLCL